MSDGLFIFLGALTLLFIGFVCGLGAEDSLVRAPMRAKAVEMGAASWVTDQKTGNTEFTWKDAKP